MSNRSMSRLQPMSPLLATKIPYNNFSRSAPRNGILRVPSPPPYFLYKASSSGRSIVYCPAGEGGEGGEHRRHTRLKNNRYLSQNRYVNPRTWLFSNILYSPCRRPRQITVQHRSSRKRSPTTSHETTREVMGQCRVVPFQELTSPSGQSTPTRLLA